MIVYRQSHVKAAGFDSVPKDTAGFLKLLQGLNLRQFPSGIPIQRSAQAADLVEGGGQRAVAQNVGDAG